METDKMDEVIALLKEQNSLLRHLFSLGNLPRGFPLAGKTSNTPVNVQSLIYRPKEEASVKANDNLKRE